MNVYQPELIVIQMVAIILAFLFAVTFHEFSHAAMANFLGDPTAKRHGRLSLNPLRHLDVLGILFLFIFRIGWARPVPFDRQNFKYPRLFSVFVALAGPLANFVIAFCFLWLIRLVSINQYFLLPISRTSVYIFQVIVEINIMLGVFNLLPLPPLDGSHLLFVLIPPRLYRLWFALQQYMIFVLILLFALPQTRYSFWLAVSYVKIFLSSLVF